MSYISPARRNEPSFRTPEVPTHPSRRAATSGGRTHFRSIGLPKPSSKHLESPEPGIRYSISYVPGISEHRIEPCNNLEDAQIRIVLLSCEVERISEMNYKLVKENEVLKTRYEKSKREEDLENKLAIILAENEKLNQVIEDISEVYFAEKTLNTATSEKQKGVDKIMQQLEQAKQTHQGSQFTFGNVQTHREVGPLSERSLNEDALNDLRQGNSALNIENNRMRKEIETLRAKCKELSVFETRMNVYENTLRVLLEENENLNQLLRGKVVRRSHNNLSDKDWIENVEFEPEMEKVKEEHEALKDLYKGQEINLEKLNQKAEELIKENKRLSREIIRQSETPVAEERKKSFESPQPYERMRGHIETLLQKNEELNNVLSEKEIETETLYRRIRELEDLRESQVSTLNTRVEGLIAEKKTLENSLKEKVAEIQLLKMEKERINGRLKELENTHLLNAHVEEDLRKKLSEANAENERYKVRLDGKKEKRRKINVMGEKKNLSVVTYPEVEELRKKLSEANAENERYKVRLDGLNRNLQDKELVSMQLVRVRAENEELIRKINVMGETKNPSVVTYQEVEEELKKKLSVVNAENERYKVILDGLNRNLQDKELVSIQLVKVRAENEELIRKINVMGETKNPSVVTYQEVDRLNRIIQEKERDIESLKSRLEIKERALESLASNKSKVESAVKGNDEELRMLSVLVEEKDRQIQGLNILLTKANMEVRDVSKSLQELESVRSEVLRLKSENERLSKDSSQRMVEMEGAHNKGEVATRTARTGTQIEAAEIKTNNEALEKKEQEMKQLQYTIMRLCGEKEELQKKVKELEESKGKGVANKGQEILEITNKIEQAEKELTVLSNENGKLHLRIIEKESEMKETSNLLRAKTEECESLRRAARDNSSGGDEVLKIRQENEGLKSRLTLTEAELNKAKNDLSNSVATKLKLEEEIGILSRRAESEVNRSSSAIVEKDKELESLRRKIQEQEGVMEGLRALRMEAEEKVRGIANESRRNTELLEAKEMEIKKLNDLQWVTVNAKDELEKRVKEFEEFRIKAVKAQEEHEGLLLILTDKRREIHNLKEDIQNKEQSLKDLSKLSVENGQLKGNLYEKEREIKTISESLSLRSEECEELKREVRKSNEELLRLRQENEGLYEKITQKEKELEILKHDLAANIEARLKLEEEAGLNMRNSETEKMKLSEVMVEKEREIENLRLMKVDVEEKVKALIEENKRQKGLLYLKEHEISEANTSRSKVINEKEELEKKMKEFEELKTKSAQTGEQSEGLILILSDKRREIHELKKKIENKEQTEKEIEALGSENERLKIEVGVKEEELRKANELVRIKDQECEDLKKEGQERIMFLISEQKRLNELLEVKEHELNQVNEAKMVFVHGKEELERKLRESAIELNGKEEEIRRLNELVRVKSVECEQVMKGEQERIEFLLGEQKRQNELLELKEHEANQAHSSRLRLSDEKEELERKMKDFDELKAKSIQSGQQSEGLILILSDKRKEIQDLKDKVEQKEQIEKDNIDLLAKEEEIRRLNELVRIKGMECEQVKKEAQERIEFLLSEQKRQNEILVMKEHEVNQAHSSRLRVSDEKEELERKMKDFEELKAKSIQSGQQSEGLVLILSDKRKEIQDLKDKVEQKEQIGKDNIDLHAKEEEIRRLNELVRVKGMECEQVKKEAQERIEFLLSEQKRQNEILVMKEHELNQANSSRLRLSDDKEELEKKMKEFEELKVKNVQTGQQSEGLMLILSDKRKEIQDLKDKAEQKEHIRKDATTVLAENDRLKLSLAIKEEEVRKVNELLSLKSQECETLRRQSGIVRIDRPEILGMSNDNMSPVMTFRQAELSGIRNENESPHALVGSLNISNLKMDEGTLNFMVMQKDKEIEKLYLRLEEYEEIIEDLEAQRAEGAQKLQNLMKEVERLGIQVNIKEIEGSQVRSSVHNSTLALEKEELQRKTLELEELKNKSAQMGYQSGTLSVVIADKSREVEELKTRIEVREQNIKDVLGGSRLNMSGKEEEFKTSHELVRARTREGEHLREQIRVEGGERQHMNIAQRSGEASRVRSYLEPSQTVIESLTNSKVNDRSVVDNTVVMQKDKEIEALRLKLGDYQRMIESFANQKLEGRERSPISRQDSKKAEEIMKVTQSDLSGLNVLQSQLVNEKEELQRKMRVFEELKAKSFQPGGEYLAVNLPEKSKEIQDLKTRVEVKEKVEKEIVGLADENQRLRVYLAEKERDSKVTDDVLRKKVEECESFKKLFSSGNVDAAKYLKANQEIEALKLKLSDYQKMVESFANQKLESRERSPISRQDSKKAEEIMKVTQSDFSGLNVLQSQLVNEKEELQRKMRVFEELKAKSVQPGGEYLAANLSEKSKEIQELQTKVEVKEKVEKEIVDLANENQRLRVYLAEKERDSRVKAEECESLKNLITRGNVDANEYLKVKKENETLSLKLVDYQKIIESQQTESKDRSLLSRQASKKAEEMLSSPKNDLSGLNSLQLQLVNEKQELQEKMKVFEELKVKSIQPGGEYLAINLPEKSKEIQDLMTKVEVKEKVEKEITDLNNENQRLRVYLAEKERDSKVADDVLRKKVEECESFKKLFSSGNVDAAKYLKANQEIEALKLKLSDYQKMVESFANQKLESRERSPISRQDSKKAEEIMKATQSDFSGLNALQSQLETEKKDLQQKLKDFEELRAKSIQTRNESLGANLSEKSKEIQELKTRVEVKEKVEKEIVDLANENQRLRVYLAEKERDSRAAEESLRAKTEECESLKSFITKGNLDATEYLKIKKENQALNLKLGDYQKMVESFATQRLEGRERSPISRQDSKTAEEILNSPKNDLSGLNSLQMQLMGEKEELQKKMKVFEELKVKSIQPGGEALAANLSEKSKEIQDLKTKVEVKEMVEKEITDLASENQRLRVYLAEKERDSRVAEEALKVIEALKTGKLKMEEIELKNDQYENNRALSSVLRQDSGSQMLNRRLMNVDQESEGSVSIRNEKPVSPIIIKKEGEKPVRLALDRDIDREGILSPYRTPTPGIMGEEDINKRLMMLEAENKRLVALVKERGNLIEPISDLQSADGDNNSFSVDIEEATNFRAEITRLKKENDKLAAVIDAKGSEIRALLNDQESKGKNMEGYKVIFAQVEEARKQTVELAHENKRLQDIINEKENGLVNLNNKLKELTNQVTGSRENVPSLSQTKQGDSPSRRQQGRSTPKIEESSRGVQEKEIEKQIEVLKKVVGASEGRLQIPLNLPVEVKELQNMLVDLDKENKVLKHALENRDREMREIAEVSGEIQMEITRIKQENEMLLGIIQEKGYGIRMSRSDRQTSNKTVERGELEGEDAKRQIASLVNEIRSYPASQVLDERERELRQANSIKISRTDTGQTYEAGLARLRSENPEVEAIIKIMEQKEAEIESLKKAIEIKDRAIESIKASLEEIDKEEREKVEALEAENRRLEEFVNSVSANDKKSELFRKAEEVYRTQKEIAFVKDENAKLVRLVEEKQMEIENLTSALDEKDKTIESVKGFDTGFQELEKMVELLVAENERLKGLLGQKMDESKRLRDERNQARRELARVGNRREEESPSPIVAGFTKADSNIMERIGSEIKLARTLDEKEKEIRQLKKELAKRGGEQGLRRKNTDEELNELREQAQKSEEERDTAIEKINRLNNEIERLQGHLNRTMKELQEEKKKFSELEVLRAQEIDRLRREYEAPEKMELGLDDEELVLQFEAERLAYETQLEQMQTKLGDLEEENKSLKEEVNGLRKLSAQRLKEVEESKKQLQEVRETSRLEVMEANKKISQLKMKHQELNLAMIKNKSGKAPEQGTIKGLQEENQKLKEENEQLHALVEEGHKEYLELSQQHEELLQVHEDLKQETQEKLNESLRRMEKIEVLQREVNELQKSKEEYKKRAERSNFELMKKNKELVETIQSLEAARLRYQDFIESYNSVETDRSNEQEIGK